MIYLLLSALAFNPLSQRRVEAVVQGGDQALYAAVEGALLRSEGGSWRVVGRYTPELLWNGEEIEAQGPFPQERLELLAEKVRQEIEEETGLELSGELLSEALILDLLKVMTLELSRDPHYAFVDLQPSPTGVWLGTRAGLFKGTRSLEGPLSPPLFAFSAQGEQVWTLNRDGVFELESGELIHSPVEGIAAQPDGLWLLKKGRLEERPEPGGKLRQILADEQGLWALSVEGQVSRFQGSWILCPALPEPPRQLRSLAQGVAALGQEQIYRSSDDCQRWESFQPWLGGGLINDAFLWEEELWLATTEGLIRAQMILGSGPAFRAAIEALPPLYKVTQDALLAQHLDLDSQSYGSRPQWRALLPELSAALDWNPSRNEKDPTLIHGSGQWEIGAPRFSWSVSLLWSVDTSLFAPLSVERTQAQEQLGIPELELQTELDESALEAEEAKVEGLAEAFIAENRWIRRERWKLSEEIRSLYREQLRIMAQLWTAQIPQAEALILLLRKDEIDALLWAYTGGRWGED